MTRPSVLALAVLSLASLAGCKYHQHLTYDFGRAYTAAVTTQADLTRPSVANSEYFLEGSEAAKIRMQLEETTTDKALPMVTFNTGQ